MATGQVRGANAGISHDERGHKRVRSIREETAGAERVATHSRRGTRAYDVAAVETRWRDRWERTRIYQVDLQRAKHPYYNLMMFPYPSAEGLHVGNMYSYVGSDVHGRWKAMSGFDVFEPMGFDAFGIHSENFAIKMGVHPRPMTARNIERFRDQLKRVGNRFDWSHEVQTTDPAYYRWTQWIFIQLFKAGLAERKSAAVNWCPKDKTVLADEQVIAGRCERCGTVVERHQLQQWFFTITKYADTLLKDLDTLDWSERVKTAQRNWIGRSEGLEFEMAVAGHRGVAIRAYTTRPDTIYGVTFVVLSPEHPLVEQITTDAHRDAVTAYQEQAQRRRTELDAAEREVTGVFTGAYAIHPLTGEQVPIWIADYVLLEYGTGAVMAVPAHDERDLAFARTMGLPVRVVVRPVEAGSDESVVPVAGDAYTDDGVLVASGEYSGMSSGEARTAIGEAFERRGVGHRAVKYHLRDWLISRQRYWGPPIPIIYCPDHGAVPVPEEQLPVLLPDLEDYMPSGTGTSPLASIESFVNTTCPICGKPAKRETDVNDNFLDSAWYFLRYPSSGDDTEPWDPTLTRKWLPVDMYVGGAEHSVLHLLYTRFITMALHDLGHLDFAEPFKHFRANGTITHDGAKMSKSRGNVISPDSYIDEYGADAFRTYLMFMGPYEAGGDFSDRGVGGISRFLDRVWQYVTRHAATASKEAPKGDARRALHATIQQVTGDIAVLKYNTAIAALMKLLNVLERQQTVTREELRTFVLLLAPFAPFVADELWERLGGKGSVHTQRWPEFDAAAVRAETLQIVVQVNGRVRDTVEVPAGASPDDVKRVAQEATNARRFTEGQTIRQVIYVPGRLVNIVLT
jgi:leucyl-tRNA synthetase